MLAWRWARAFGAADGWIATWALPDCGMVGRAAGGPSTVRTAWRTTALIVVRRSWASWPSAAHSVSDR